MFTMTSKFSLLGALTLSLLGVTACVAGDGSADDESVGADEAVTGQASVRMANGKLQYIKDSNGDTIPDFSHAGYHSGGVPLPNVKVVKELSPSAGDNLKAIQAAIDAVASLPLAQRGAIHLKKGVYHLSGTLQINDSGIVLRGDGDGENGTVLMSTSRSPIVMLAIQGGGPSYGSAVKVTDKYVPVGATSLSLASTAGLSKGDTIVIDRPSTKEWIHAIRMDKIQWQPGDHDIHAERIITDIQGNTVFFDAPLTTSLDVIYGGGTVRKLTKDDRISEVGVEFLRGVAMEKVTDRTDLNHPNDFIQMTGVKNSWVQNVTGTHFLHSVVNITTGNVSKWVTVRRSTALEPVGPRKGGYFYAFATDGQMTLFHDCVSSDGRHDYVTGDTVAQLNVFLESVRKVGDYTGPRPEEVGPHAYWASGVLFDSMTIEGGNLSAHDEANAGSGHGWSAANMVTWNSTASDGFICERPPTAHQWIFGSTGKVQIQKHPDLACNEVVSPGKAMLPKSLYRQQLAERMGAGAVKSALDD